MAEELFNFYKSELGMYNMVFKHIKKSYWSSIILPIIVSLSMIGLKVFNLIADTDLYISAIIFGVIYIIYTFGFINHKIKKTTMELYEKKSKKFMWYSDYEVIEAIKEKQRKKMIEYLVKKEFVKKIDIIECLQESSTKILLKDIKKLKKELKHSRYKGFIMPSIFGALFISLWNNFFGWVYNVKNTANPMDAINILVGSTLALITVIGLFIMLKSIYNVVTEDIFDKDYRKISECEKLLKEIYNNYKKNGDYQN